MRVLIATNNQDKIKEIKEVLDDFEFFSLDDLGIKSDPVEDANTYEGNARIKAEAAKVLCPEGYAVLADDSGLSVESLDGAPGLYSARYAGINGEHPTYKDNCDKLLAALKGEKNRKAYFESDIVMILPDGKTLHTVGVCEGKIATEPRGKNGFGYDPIFLPKAHDYKYTMAQLPEGGKNAISHRGIALKKLKDLLDL
ncbi:MAG: RdgB/HAM1 family non-canonical purine NTP pyrophosphatase [Coriobacteriia bacterium]|nr:RdgB/HAM1 family non-canonical purine NTP pyrophosphatase [Coriobacteriia bacterium]